MRRGKRTYEHTFVYFLSFLPSTPSFSDWLIKAGLSHSLPRYRQRLCDTSALWSGILLPSATKCFPQWHSARWWGGRRWWAPWGSEHTQLPTAGHCREQLDARDTRPLRTAWASGNESLVGSVCLGARPAGERDVPKHCIRRTSSSLSLLPTPLVTR